ncbi:unnamed protein product, partial [Oppiella nova]
DLSMDDTEVPVHNNIESQFTKQLCRGVSLLSEAMKSRLKCFHLNTSQIPFLRLTRIKVEEMHEKPQIVVIHQFLSDNEVEVMKLLAKPKLVRTSTINEQTKTHQIDRNRIAEGGWPKDWENSVVNTISQRIAHITGMDIRLAEEYQAIKYGVGGYYRPHYDVFVPWATQLDAKIYGDHLNRVATWINYLSDVDVGGATIFPHLNVTVWPEKGSALLWFNLFKSGIIDMTTLHGGCPVVIGTKWIATKWIPELGQNVLLEEINWIKDLNTYVSLEEQRLIKIRQLTDEFTRQNWVAMKDVDTYVGHPIDVYHLIKRFSVEWKQLEELLVSQKNVYQHYQDLILDHELTDAAKGMATLVDTYKLDIHSLVDGLIRKQSFVNKQYFNAIQWFNETIIRGVVHEMPTKMKTDLYKYLSMAYYKMGDTNQALLYMQHSIALNPYNEHNSNSVNQIFVELFWKKRKQ